MDNSSFHKTWLRIQWFTEWESQTEMADFLGIKSQNVSTEREQDLMDRKLLQRLMNRVDQLELAD